MNDSILTNYFQGLPRSCVLRRMGEQEQVKKEQKQQ